MKTRNFIDISDTLRKINLLKGLTSQANLVIDAGFRPSLHANYHHQILYAKFNLKIHYLPQYEREVCIFKKLVPILLEGR